MISQVLPKQHPPFSGGTSSEELLFEAFEEAGDPSNLCGHCCSQQLLKVLEEGRVAAPFLWCLCLSCPLAVPGPGLSSFTYPTRCEESGVAVYASGCRSSRLQTVSSILPGTLCRSVRTRGFGTPHCSLQCPRWSACLLQVTFLTAVPRQSSPDLASHSLHSQLSPKTG